MDSSTSRKRPSGLPNPIPSKRPQRLSIGMDRLQLDDVVVIGLQKTVPNSSNLQQQQQQQQQESSQQASLAQQQGVQRRSTMLNANARRGSSIFARPVINSNAVERFNANLPPQPNKKFVGEPKHIKENDTQRKYLKSITEYLHETKYKGTNPPINYRALGARDFQAMFKHLVHRLVPEHEFKRKFDEDVMDIIRLLKYPLVDFFNQKHLLNIGAPHSIHVFYALLMWLTEMCRTIDQSIGYDEGEPLTQEQLFEEYSIECYHQYMDGHDDMTEQNKKLQMLFDEFNEQNKKILEEKALSNMSLQKEIDHLKQIESPLHTYMINNQLLKQDMEKFAVYMETLRKKIERYIGVNEDIQKAVSEMEQKKLNMQKDIDRIDAKLRARNTTLEEIEELEFIHAQYQKDNADIAIEVEQLKQSIAEKEFRVIRLRQEADTIVKDYNTNVDVNFPKNDQLKIKYNPDGTTLKEMLNYVDIDHDILPKLEKISDESKQELTNTVEETMLLRETSDTFKAQIIEKKSELALLEERTITRKKFHEEKHIKAQEENRAYNLMIDSHEKGLEEKREKANELIFKAKQALVEHQTTLKNVSQVTESEEKRAVSKLQHALSEITTNFEKIDIVTNNLNTKSRHQKDIIEKLLLKQ